MKIISVLNGSFITNTILKMVVNTSDNLKEDMTGIFNYYISCTLWLYCCFMYKTSFFCDIFKTCLAFLKNMIYDLEKKKIAYFRTKLSPLVSSSL